MPVVGGLTFNISTVRNPAYGTPYTAIIRRYLDELGGNGPSLSISSPNFYTWSSSMDDAGSQFNLPLAIDAGAYGKLVGLAVASEGFFGFIKEGIAMASQGAWTNTGAFFADKGREYWNTKPNVAFVTRYNADNSVGRVWIWSVTNPSTGVVLGSVIRICFSTSTSFSEGSLYDIIIQVTSRGFKFYGLRTGTAGSFPLQMQVDSTANRYNIHTENWLSAYTSDEVVITFNNPPSTPSVFNVSPRANEQLQGLTKTSMSASGATDADGQSPTYFFEFYNGSTWIEFARNVPANKSVSHTLPNKDIPNARYRVRAFDGFDYGEYRTSSVIFSVKKTDTILPPGGFRFDGTGGFVSVTNRIIPTSGPWTIEFSFKTTQLHTSIFAIDNGTNQIISAQMNGGTFNVVVDGSGASVAGLNDNKLHHVAITHENNVVKVFIDGIYKYSVSKAVPSIAGSFYLANSVVFKYGAAQPFNGVIGLPRFWSVALTEQQISSYKGKPVPDSQSGLIDYMIFDDTTGLAKMKKQAYAVSMPGYVEWTILFASITGVKLPALNPQKVENLSYLREKVNLFRRENGLSDVKWSEPFIVAGHTTIKASHWNEIEDSILEVYDASGQAFASSITEAQFRQDIKPHDPRYPIQGLSQRLNNIVRGLLNN